jgi:hypothetical protein
MRAYIAGLKEKAKALGRPSRRYRAKANKAKAELNGKATHNAVGLTFADRLAILWLYRHGADRHATAGAFGISTAMLHRIVRQEASRLTPGRVRKTR